MNELVPKTDMERQKNKLIYSTHIQSVKLCSEQNCLQSQHRNKITFTLSVICLYLMSSEYSYTIPIQNIPEPYSPVC